MRHVGELFKIVMVGRVGSGGLSNGALGGCKGAGVLTRELERDRSGNKSVSF